MNALSRKLLRDLKTLRLQILTMSILITCGVAVLVASWSSYNSLQNAKENYYDRYRFADVFAEVVRAPKSLLAQVQNLPKVEIAEARIIEDTLLDMPSQAEPALGRIISYNTTSQLNKIYLRQGRLPEASTPIEVLVHESFAKAHQLKSGDSFFATLRGHKERLVVSGIGLSPEYVYALSPVAPFPDDLHFGILWMPEKELEKISNMQGAFNSLLLKTSKGASLPEIEKQLDQILSPFGGIGSYDRSLQVSHMFVQDEIRQQRSMSTIVPGIFILVAIFILYTTMSRLIGLQRTQIAALKALGYSSKELVFYYLRLVSIILTIGTLPGVLAAQFIGKWYAHLYEQYFRFPNIDFNLSKESIILGLIAGTIPGWMASTMALLSVFSLNPAEAMRPPNPTSFSSTFLNFSHVLKPKSIQSKMVFRNILARPWRFFLSVLGIAAATGILINGSFWSDIIDFMIERQFYQVSREDLEVQLRHPRPREALREISHLEGVYNIEGARSVAIRLLFKNFKKETAILTSEPSSTMRRVLNLNGKELSIPEGHILLSRYFAKKFFLKIGDIVTIQVSDKTTPDFKATVGGFVDDVVGATVYAHKSDLHSWLHEEPSFNTFFIKADPTQAERIYIKLKQMPEVASINIKKLLYASFTKNLSEMIWTFTLILVTFATIIAGAVQFNMARISLSEKSWELASLKIIGFEVPQVFLVLFLELGICVLCSLGPGIILGYSLSYVSLKWIHTESFTYPLVIDIKTYALAVIVIVITYFIAGLFLYKKVEDLNMTAALKARE
ncbi:MAG: ABC transporter permease [Bacillota bacterium]